MYPTPDALSRTAVPSRLPRALVLLAALLAVPAGATTSPHLQNGIACTACHDIHGRTYTVIRGAEQETLCRECHVEGGMASGLTMFANHVVNDGVTLIDCGSCHNVHKYSVTTDSHTGVKAENLDLIRSDTTRYVTQAKKPALFQSKPAGFAYSTEPWTGICQT